MLPDGLKNDLRRCKVCKKSKPESEFYRVKKKRENTRYFHGKCKTCYKKVSNRWYKSNRESWLESRRKYYHKNKEKVRANTRRLKYGISQEQFDQMLSDQENRCAICRSDAPGGKGSWTTDHDHKTGRVRGILCNPCNQGLGIFGDNPATLMQAILYLGRENVRLWLKDNKAVAEEISKKLFSPDNLLASK